MGGKPARWPVQPRVEAVKLGLVTDIHEDIEHLQAALDRFRTAAVERIVMLGDIFETGPRLDAAVAILADAGAIGVWGNHDFGLCVDPSDFARGRFRPATLAYMATLRPRLELDGCLFTHVEPWLDPTDIRQLWHVEDRPLTPELIARSLDAAPQRVLFLGHFHRWLAATGAGLLPWDGRSPLRLDPAERYLVIINGVVEGWCATYDTATGELVPIDLRTGPRPAASHASG
ncbi:MAG TPA: metallophosphoesterase family protein [Isosphaeraceae bacterium]